MTDAVVEREEVPVDLRVFDEGDRFNGAMLVAACAACTIVNSETSRELHIVRGDGGLALASPLPGYDVTERLWIPRDRADVDRLIYDRKPKGHPASNLRMGADVLYDMMSLYMIMGLSDYSLDEQIDQDDRPLPVLSCLRSEVLSIMP